jgi:DNA-binding transcriptional LysR family regulator
VIDKLAALKLFVQVARTGSFSSGGREVRLSQPSASRLIAALERDVGTALFNRTTRIVTLTEAGKAYLSRIDVMLSSLEEADHEAKGTGELRGTLKVSLPTSLARREIIPRLPRFAAKHPSLDMELSISDQRLDLLSSGVDVALRMGPLSDSTAIARLVGTSARILVASPSYIELSGMPCTPAELAEHAIIIGPMSKSLSWSFRKDGRLASVQIRGRLFVTTNEGALTAAAAGYGIVSSSHGACRNDLECGVLKLVLEDWDMGLIEVHALYPGGKAAKPAARAFGDFVATEFRLTSYLNPSRPLPEQSLVRPGDESSDTCFPCQSVPGAGSGRGTS